MLEYLERNKLLSENQHGSTKNKSCLTNLLETLEEITTCLDNDEGVDVVFLDYRKAFDGSRVISPVSRFARESFCPWVVLPWVVSP